MEKKSLKEMLKKINIIDLFAVIIIALVILLVLWKVTNKPQETPDGAASGTVTPAPGASTVTPAPGTSEDKTPGDEEDPLVYVTFKIRVENRAAELYEAVKARVPGQLMASGVLQNGWVVDVEKKPVMVLTADGNWVENPDRVTLLFTIEGTAPRTEVLTSKVGTQEIRIGDPGYDFVTQYLEFMDSTIVDVSWEDWDFGADREETRESNAEKLKKNGMHPVTFTVRAEDRPAELYENIQEHIPSQLMAGGVLQDGWVVGVEKEPVMVLADNGEWVENPDRATLIFTIDAFALQNDPQSVLVGTQEIRLGRIKYTLKTEYLEFRNTVVTDIQWKD